MQSTLIIPCCVYVKPFGLMGLLLEMMSDGVVIVSIPTDNYMESEVYRAVEKKDIDAYVR